ncbi:MAG: MmcQ/YjbR family DNA-binding protein [bacterium]
MTVDPEALRSRVREIALAFPGTSERIENPVHSAFMAKTKAFCYFLNDHHGDGVVGINCKAMPGVQAALVDLDPVRFYLPAYMARWGWVGMRLDREPIDWPQVQQLVTEAFLASAPKALLKEYEATRTS